MMEAGGDNLPTLSVVYMYVCMWSAYCIIMNACVCARDGGGGGGGWFGSLSENVYLKHKFRLLFLL